MLLRRVVSNVSLILTLKLGEDSQPFRNPCRCSANFIRTENTPKPQCCDLVGFSNPRTNRTICQKLWRLLKCEPVRLMTSGQEKLRYTPTCQRDRRIDRYIHIYTLAFIYTCSIYNTHLKSILYNPLELFSKGTSRIVCRFQVSQRTKLCVVFLDRKLEFRPSLRLSEYHHLTSGLVMCTTWHCWALDGDKWRGRHLLHRNLWAYEASRLFLFNRSSDLSSTYLFLLNVFFLFWDVNNYSPLIAVVYQDYCINSRDFRIQVF